MKILITNDDGINSEGLIALANLLSQKNEIVVYAPDGNRSGYSRSMSFHKDITLKEVNFIKGIKAYTLSGTPCDCVKYALTFEKNVDLVVAGINLGANICYDIVYSGTVNACVEANLLGYKAIAFSNISYNNYLFNENCKVIEEIFDKLVDISSKNYTLNVNMPNLNKKDIKGIKFSKIGKRLYTDIYKKTGENTVQLTGEPIKSEFLNCEDDDYLTEMGYVTITPIKSSPLDEETYNKYKDYKF